jgi:tight adherence protein C
MIGPSQIPIVASVLAFVVFILAFVGIRQILRIYEKRKALLGRINVENVTWESSGGDTLSSPARTGAIGRFLESLGSLGKRKEGEGLEEYSNARAKFLRAGLQQHSAPKLFWGAKILLAGLFPIVFLAAGFAVLGVFDPAKTIGSLVLCGLLGFYLPELWLMVRTSSRKTRIFEGLPDALDLMVVCVEAGMGLDQAVNQVGEELKLNHKDLSDEFKLLNLELRAGKARQAALRNLAVRTGVEEVNSLVTLLVQTDRFGTSVAQALRVYSDSFRTKRYQKAEEIAAKLPVKLVFPVVLFIFPSLFIIILGPAAISIYESFLSR